MGQPGKPLRNKKGKIVIFKGPDKDRIAIYQGNSEYSIIPVSEYKENRKLSYRAPRKK